MESMEIEILSFINPHIFYIATDVDVNHRTNFLKNVSSRIKKCHPENFMDPDKLLPDEIVAVNYKSEFARATVLEKILNEENHAKLYFCWLIDYAELIKTDNVFKLSKEIQKITPRCRQASLNNICYLKEHLELGVTGSIKNVPSIVPSSGVVQYALELISNYSKLTFEVAERFENILIGEVIIHKNGQVLYLTKELCNKGLLTINELLFRNLKYSTKEYIQTHLKTIQLICNTTQKRASQNSSLDRSLSPMSSVEKFLKIDMEELDINSSPPLENGRRRKGSFNQSTSTTTDSSNKTKIKKDCQNLVNKISTEPDSDLLPQNQAPLVPKTIVSELDILDQKPKTSSEGTRALSRSDRLLREIKARKSLEGAKQTLDQEKNEPKHVNTPKSSNCSNKSAQDCTSATCDSSSASEEKTNDDSSISEKNVCSEEKTLSLISSGTELGTPVSPFSHLTSQRKNKPKGLFFPAGMERTMNQTNRKSTSPKQVSKFVGVKESVSKNTPEATANKPESSPKASTDDDCPTIKIPKASDSVTDDQLSAEDKSEKREESTSSDTHKPEIFTKQDFCRLVAGCTCITCRVTLEDDDWDAPLKFDSPAGETKKKSKTAGIIIKPPKLLKPVAQIVENGIHQNEILSVDYNGMSAMEKKLSCKVLVHGESIPIPIKHVAQVNIHREIYNNISRINYKESKRIQHYAFPAITRNHHVFMVNDQKSGKTMAYLPILISFIMEKEERYSQLFKMGGGPLVVILCNNSQKCEEIHDVTRLILDRQKRKFSLVTYPGYGNMSNVDILITMPTVLSTLISTRATNFKRLCHLVLEDADVILKSHNELIKKYLHYADQVLEHRSCPKSVQLILCAQHWTVQMEDILMKLNKMPLVCIGNHLEAALYGKMKFTMKFLDSGCKEQNLQKILLDKYKYTKSVVICNPDELEDVQTFLILKGIEYTSFIGVNREEDILYLEAVWNKAQPGKFSVLLCTDDIFNTMNITSAHLLIHFSLPQTWTQFIRRFSCVLENIQAPVDVNQKKHEISTFVFIDENCETRMSKFSNFIKIAGLEKELPEKIKTFFQGITLQEESRRVSRKAELCETLKVFGKCDSLNCKKRHLLDKDVDSSDILPRNGSIRFKIQKMTTAGSCSIKILEHFDLNGKRVRQFEDLTNDITDLLARKTHYHQISKAVVTHLYLHKDNDQYFRCKLLEMDDFALIFLIDKGIYCKSSINRLFKMPDELKKIPPQCYEIHFANLIPPYDDNRFSRMAGRKAQFLVESDCADSVMRGIVVLQLGSNLWLDDVYEQREMHDKNLPSIGFQLTRELVKEGLAIKSNKPLQQLYNLCKKAEIELPEYRVARPTVKTVTVNQVQPNWAFLDVGAIHEVTFSCAANPGEFYIRQNKFIKQLLQLEEDIQKEIRKPFYPVPEKIEVGKCYLVKDQVSGDYARGMVLSIEKEQAEVLCVDYGDIAFEDISNLKHISDESILKLPFQSIQCSMYGIKPIEDDWIDAATDLLYTKAFEEDNRNLRPLFVKISTKQENSVVKRQNSYSVTLKDGLERRVIINELLIDCGYALPSGHEIEDFALPEVTPESDDDYIEKAEEYVDDDDSRDDFAAPADGIDFEAFDCEILSLADFMIDMKLPVKKISDSKAIEDKIARTSELPAIKAAPAVDYLTPEVYWSQTDTALKLNINIYDVVSVKIALKHNRSFQFNTEKAGKTYFLNFLLFAKVETPQYTILGSQVRVTLKKCKAAEWPRLLYTQDKVRKIYYDIAALNLEDDDEKKPRRPLQLDISDSSSVEGDDDDERPYFVCSDLDSDYDYDIPNDE